MNHRCCGQSYWQILDTRYASLLSTLCRQIRASLPTQTVVGMCAIVEGDSCTHADYVCVCECGTPPPTPTLTLCSSDCDPNNKKQQHIYARSIVPRHTHTYTHVHDTHTCPRTQTNNNNCNHTSTGDSLSPAIRFLYLIVSTLIVTLIINRVHS